MTDRELERIDDELLEDWVEGFLESETARQIAAAVADDADLQEKVSALTKERELFSSALKWTADHRPRKDEKVAVLPSPVSWRQRPAFIVAGLAASLALIALPVWIFGGFQGAPTDPQGPPVAAVVDPVDERPTIQLESLEAAAGETVYVILRARHLSGFCGLQARVLVAEGLEAMSARGSGFTYAGVRDGEVSIASISEDGWSAEDGVILRLPIKVADSIGAQRELALEFDNLRLIDADRRQLEVRKQSARIRVL